MPLLSPQETQVLSALLRQARHKALDSSLNDFTAAFGPGRIFQALLFAASILEASHENRVADRLVGYYFLSETTKAASGPACPLRSLIGQVLLKSRRSPVEQAFVFRLVIKKEAQLGQLVPTQYIQSFSAGAAVSQTELQQLHTFLTEAPKPFAATSRPARNSSRAPNNAAASAGDAAGTASGKADAAHQTALAMLQSLQLGGCPAPFILPPPPLLPPLEGEVRWMQPEVPYELLWNPAVEREGGRLKQLQEQLLAASRGPLVPTRQRDLLNALAEDSGLMQCLRITAAQLPGLVEHNPNVAVQVLVQLLQTDKAAAFLQTLLGMDLTLHSMEVVNRLTAVPKMPLEFLHLYISHCLASCADAKDKGVQNRLVRLVCVFLQSLVGKQFAAIQALLVEIQSFCIEFSRFREAASLFRQLKQLQSDGSDSAASEASGSAAFVMREANGQLDGAV